jgi:hypothetical protein
MDCQYKSKCKVELDKSMQQLQIYQENLFKAYALSPRKDVQALQNKILSRPDYKKSIYNNPIELLKAIKLHASNFQKTRYKMSILANARRAMMST